MVTARVNNSGITVLLSMAAATVACKSADTIGANPLLIYSADREKFCLIGCTSAVYLASHMFFLVIY